MPTGSAFAFGISLLAGLATLGGYLISLAGSDRSGRFLSLALSFSGGAMIFVSFGEILGKATASLDGCVSHGNAGWITLLGFFGGIGATFLLDRALPLHQGPASGTRGPTTHTSVRDAGASARIGRMGTFAAVAIALHNFPEGIASFVSALQSSPDRLALPFAIALHNVPEGVAIATPIYKATGSRSRALQITAIAALAEPIGALVAWSALDALAGSIVFGLTYAAVAGIMVYIAVDELIPAAREHGDDASATAGFVLGMAVMATSLQMMR